jgi:hypothetical protein
VNVVLDLMIPAGYRLRPAGVGTEEVSAAGLGYTKEIDMAMAGSYFITAADNGQRVSDESARLCGRFESLFRLSSRRHLSRQGRFVPELIVGVSPKGAIAA